MIHRGEIRWFKFAKPDKRRPVLILCREELINGLDQIAVVPFSTHIRNLASEVLLGPVDGMPSECTLKPEWIRAVSRGEIGPLIVQLPATRWPDVERAIRYVHGFDIPEHR